MLNAIDALASSSEVVPFELDFDTIYATQSLCSVWRSYFSSTAMLTTLPEPFVANNQTPALVLATFDINIAQDDDVYLYTGITSVIGDESNIGFILTNMRTKETKFYSVAGAEEYSAMESAKGQVQEKNYTSTFPLLINLNGFPTYLISLKDNAGLVKMYAFVDVVDYQKVVVTDSSNGIHKAAEAYLSEDGTDLSGNNSREVIVNDLVSAIIDGNTYYYFRDDDGQKYKASIKVSKNNMPFIKDGDVIRIKYSKEADVITITDIEF